MHHALNVSCIGIFACRCNLRGHQCLHFGKYPIDFVGRIVLTSKVLQAAKDVAASKDVLAELFERIGFFFKRLEPYTEVTPSAAMTDIITEIMVEVLTIFGIATKEIGRGSASEFPIGRL